MIGKVEKQYQPSKSENKILHFWKTHRAYEKTKKRLANRPKFYFLDGPPYVTNPPHVGTAWNKTLKDVVIRYWRMKSFNVRDQPGYDCHGLPIELMVEKSLNIASKKDIENVLGIDRFIAECKKYAEKNIKAQTSVFKDVGVWMDWDHPYITYDENYMQSVWWTIKKAHEKNALYKGVKVVHWCPRDETALAGYEVTDEYRMIKDFSTYVKLPIRNRPREYILIWTTTPWTLPANEGAMVHPGKTYVKVEVDGEKLILANERLEPVLGKRDYRIIEDFQGSKLEGLSYVPPLLEETQAKTGGNLHRVLLSAEHVTMTEGTGIVHMAPGHGEEDYEVGMRYGLPVLSPVDASGRFTAEAGKYAGLYVREANPVIIQDLKTKNLLFKEEIIEHSYPHCWRCKTPLILRATDQWFLKITAFKEKMMAENEKVKWVPDWAGSKRFNDWLKGARDWVISRQRYWGVPIPVWTCEKCSERTVVGSRKELDKIAINPPKKYDLHRNGVDRIKVRCKCGGTALREPDILDVWLDAGVASWADLGYPRNVREFKSWWPADVIVEAHDQTRGWFYSQLGPSILLFNKAPYKSVLMHGHTFDEQGERMSKSRGNIISPREVIQKHGRDALRYYTLQSTVWEDFSFSWTATEAAARSLQIIWNVFSFATLYMNLDKFNPQRWTILKLSRSLLPEDKWLLSKTASLVKQVTESMESLQFHLAVRALGEFCIEDLSHWYIRLVRRRFWLERESRDKLAAYAVLYSALKTWITLAAPIMPFLTETLYQDAFRKSEREPLETVHMSLWPKTQRIFVNTKLEEEMRIVQHIAGAVSSARQSKKVKLRQPVSKILLVSDKPIVERAAKNLRTLLLRQANAKEVEIVSLDEEERLKKLTVEPNFKKIGPVFKQQANQLAAKLRELEGRELFQTLNQEHEYVLEIGENTYKITYDMVSFREEIPENHAVGTFEEGRVYVDLTIPKELEQEGFVRDVIRRLQEMRKRLDLPVDAFVNVFVSTADPERREWLEDEQEFLINEVRAKTLLVLGPGEPRPKARLEEDWRIEGHDFRMGIYQK
ncbi:MAG TPA: isoleucine--tRNA ligase [Candidatus Bathyarchaeia archaeon]|nr:isoleucine--tRNA ligase [Candidatus Bathyarchaeia archaeon]